MKSGLPKVMHAIAGRPLIHYPVRAAFEAGCSEVVVVVGHGREHVTTYLEKAFGGRVKTAVQETQRGTGDAAAIGLRALGDGVKAALVFYGDVPLLMAEDVHAVANALVDDTGLALALATCAVDEPFGYGRIVRDAQGGIVAIREHRDLQTDEERAIREINPGVYAATMDFWREALPALRPDNAQGELYLTDVVAYAKKAGRSMHGVPSREEVLMGVNDRQQLAEADAKIAARIVRALRLQGVTVRDGARIEDGVEVERDAVLESGVVLRGATKVGEGAVIDVGSVLTNAIVGPGVTIKPYSVLTDSSVGARAQIGPFSHLRPKSEIGEEAHIGNFVETKKTRLGRGSKANHLAYLGDGVIGEGANIGAGTIFCNYDGFAKYTTVVGDGAFIGSDSQVVAPVTIGAGAYVGTGTTVTRDVPPDALAVGRARQENKEGYALRLRAKLRAAKDEAAQKTKG